jgi:exodeoxyribonuclease VII large subunit
LRLEQYQNRLASLSRALNAVSPLNVLERGYAVVRDKEGQALTRAEQFQPDQSVTLSFSDFEVLARVLEAPQPHQARKT